MSKDFWRKEEAVQAQRWEAEEDARIEELAGTGGTPLNDQFAEGKAIRPEVLVRHIAALERRIARLEQG